MRGPRTEVLEATVTSLAPGGDGVAHVDVRGERRAVFLPRTTPGDVVRAEVDFTRRPARGRLLEVVSPGPERIAPACPFSDRCGGCDWMHVSLAGQRGAHHDHVRAALPEAWRDRIVITSPGDVAAAPPSSTGGGLRYRARARVHARIDRRGRVAVGMHESGTHDPVEVDACIVLDPILDRARATLGDLLRGSTGRGEIQLGLGRVERRIAEGEVTGDAIGDARTAVLDVHWNGTLAPHVFAALEDAVRDGSIAGARLSLEGAKRPATIGDPTPWTTGADGAPLRLAPGGFGQANEEANAGLVRHVARQVREGRAATSTGPTVELYSGSGNLSVLLARDAPELVCVEADRDACAAARANLAARGLAARVVEADAGAFAWPAGTKAVVLDPPRTGARPVAERLVDGRVPLVVYVSCDTQTLGRDLALLGSAYTPRSIATFEMFPQTSHVETVVVLDRIRR
jgi:23S rRNA (uracil1939-C5)-methyltransferase